MKSIKRASVLLLGILAALATVTAYSTSDRETVPIVDPSELISNSEMAIPLTTAPIVPQAGVFCSGTVNGMVVYADGFLIIRPSWRNDWTGICDIDSTWKGIEVEVCQKWFSLLQKIDGENLNATVFYPSATTCNTLPTYGNSPAPGYVMQY